MTQKKRQIEEETVQSGDRWIWGIYIALCLVSIVESYAALSQVVGKQGLYYPLVKHCLLPFVYGETHVVEQFQCAEALGEIGRASCRERV